MTPASLSNGERFAAQPIPDGGTPAHQWIEWGRGFPKLDVTACPGIVVVAPHPDDETLGFGGTIALLSALGIDVQIIAVSDGGASHPGLVPFERGRLESTRRSEQRRSAGSLGAREPVSLGLPDGQLADHEAALADSLTEILSARDPGVWCAATWRGDGHPDHETVGRAAAVATERTGAVLVEYPLWMWHWAVPDDPAVPWERAHSSPLTRAAVGRKQVAAQSFRSQFEPIDANTAAVLPAFVLRRLLAVGEVVFL